MRLLVVAMLVLAGCAGTSGEETQTTPGRHSISGAVVDATITPVADARILFGDINATSGPDGRFVLADIEPGFYVARASKRGYTDAIAHVTVETSAAPETLKLVLIPDPTTIAFVEPVYVKGYVECSTWQAGYSFAACGAPNVASLILCSASGGQVCLGDINDDRYIYAQKFERTADFLQVEYAWDSTQALGERMRVLIGAATDQELQQPTSRVYNQTTSASPLKLTMDYEDMQESGIGSDSYFLSQTFASPSQTACVAGVCPVGAVVMQHFEMFFHLFYGFEPPADWRFTDANEVPPPPA